MSKLILGIADSHEAHACLVYDGELIAAIAEERLTRLKADSGFPINAVHQCLASTGFKPQDIDVVAVAGLSGNLFKSIYKMNALFKTDDWIRQCYEIWKPVLLEGKEFSHFEDFEKFSSVRADVKEDMYYPLVERLRSEKQKDWPKVGQKFRAEAVSSFLGIEEAKVAFFRHEDCHKAYGLYSNPCAPDKALIFTAEGGGDDSSATISTITKDLKITEHWSSNKPSVGRLYRYVTLILGMLPSQHEYKVMGLAPYGSEYHGKKALDVFRKVNEVNTLTIENKENFPDLYFSLKEALEGVRFDGIAWALQTFTEELICEWITNNIRKHKIADVVLSGGVAQNIKVCKAVGELESVNSVWAGPITGDGSLGIGAAWLAGKSADTPIIPKCLTNIYTGSGYSKDSIENEIIGFKLAEKFHISKNFTNDNVAAWLESGFVVGRFSGRMEFGQRALGNRSIIADPRQESSIQKINDKIKFRDFWMPFTPSMTYEEAGRILENPKKTYSPFMTLAFELKEAFKNSIPGAQHPADKTVRPQMLKREDNPQYYDLIEAFKRRTGMAVLLNTSFNLHGDAIVESPSDAIKTFLDCDMDILLFDHVAISRHDLTKYRG